MMGKQSGQIQMAIFDMDSMIPDNHLLRQIKNCVNFDFIYGEAAPYYSTIGRNSIDPVVLIKMLLIGYLYDIKSQQRLEEEISLNLAYCWFCGIDLMYKVPDHSIFSQNRKRHFKDVGIFREIFIEIVLKCIELEIVSGKTGVVDGSFLPFNISWNSHYEIVETINRFSIKYMEELGYLTEMTVDTSFSNPLGLCLSCFFIDSSYISKNLRIPFLFFDVRVIG